MRLSELINAEKLERDQAQLLGDDPVDRLLAMVDVAPDSPDSVEVLRRRFVGSQRACVPVRLPVARMADIRGVADRLGFVLMPFVALTREAWANEEPRMRNAIIGFDTIARGAGLYTYALSPSLYFDMRAYLASQGALPMYGSGDHAGFSALHLTLPALRAMGAEIAAANARVAAIDVRLSAVEAELGKSRARRGQRRVDRAR